ncbi:membrane protein [alpha proteobacterium U9-1i]|nr:membrane protein [alpha proteobacterium U9-1i]
MTLGPFLFGAPLALGALLALPALWWLLRATPPPPQRAAFPPTRLLMGLRTEEQSRERAPLWLVLFRALAAALMILAFARPSLAPTAAESAAGGRTLIVIDDGWTSAPHWSETRAAAIAAAQAAERAGAPVFLLLTAPDLPARDPGEALTAADAKGRISRLEPRPWRPDRADAARRLAQSEGQYARIVWITDGLQDDGAQALAQVLQQRGPVTARVPAVTARALVAGQVTPRGVEVEARRGPQGAPSGAVAAETMDGRALGAAELVFEGDGQTASARIELPPEIAARTARVRIVGEQSAGAVRLLPAGAGRPFVGVVGAGGATGSLTSEQFYVERALQPFASLQRGELGPLIDARAQALILPDAGRIAPADRTALENWLDEGGLLVRFAGPRLANDADDLLPVRLRPGSRTLGGALAWETPLGIAAFPADSPFSGLSAPSDVVVRRQVLAEPTSLEEARVWATLSDNSPLVTAQAHGRGLIVLFHVSAGPAWSDIPLSGLYVEMLRRTLAFAGRADGAGEREVTGGPFRAQRLLDGYGALNDAPPDAEPIASDAFALASPSPATPPGLYERAGVSAAIDAARPDVSLAPLQLPTGVSRAGLGTSIERPLAGYFFGIAAIMLAIDLFIALFLLGRLPRFARSGAATLFAIMLLGAGEARAQYTDDPTQTLRLAYVRTGDARVDRVSAAGLDELSQVLINRTSVEPGAPVGVDLTRDDLSPYPFLYWPAPANPRQLSDAALANIDRYLAIGGLLLVDTRDAGRGQSSQRPAAIMLQGVDAPPLEQVTSEHVVARAFYLMRSFPGRTQSPRLWSEATQAASSRDGVAALFVGDGDWASAWSGEAQLDARQRELSLRFGVNLVMVALTGNYKADQVHVPALLERMGGDR